MSPTSGFAYLVNKFPNVGQYTYGQCFNILVAVDWSKAFMSTHDTKSAHHGCPWYDGYVSRLYFVQFPIPALAVLLSSWLFDAFSRYPTSAFAISMTRLIASDFVYDTIPLSSL